jgi:hypothetical protein
MNVPQAFGISLFGAALGTLLTWLQQTVVRRQFQEELESQIDQALFGGLRHQRLLHMRRIPSSGLTCFSGPLETIPIGNGSRGRQPQEESVVVSGMPGEIPEKDGQTTADSTRNWIWGHGQRALRRL